MDCVVRTVLDTIPVLTWSARPDGEPCYLSARVVEYTGRTLKDFVRQGWHGLIHPDDLDETIRAWSHAVETGTTYHARHRLLRADSEYRRFLAHGAPVLDSEGRVIQFFGLSIDIDEITEVTEALQHAQDKLTCTTDVPTAQTFPALFHETEIALGIEAKDCNQRRHSGLRLSLRERAVLRMMGDGYSNKTIARQMSIAPETVKSYAKSIYEKLTVRSRAEAVYRAVALGLI
jgi:PAS domain S-box-containing protein